MIGQVGASDVGRSYCQSADVVFNLTVFGGLSCGYIWSAVLVRKIMKVCVTRCGSNSDHRYTLAVAIAVFLPVGINYPCI